MIKLKIFLSIVVMTALCYTGAWFFMAHKINQSLFQFYAAEAPVMEIEFYAPLPKTQGFPFAPKVIFKNGFSTRNYVVNFETVEVKGFPLPNGPMNISIDNGLRLTFGKDAKVLLLDEVQARFIIPKNVPVTKTRKHLAAWQNTVGHIQFEEVFLKRDNLRIYSQGPVGLDTNLQPIFTASSKIYGYDDIIQFFVYAGALKPFAASIGLSAMNAMAQDDLETNEKFVEFDMTLKDRNLSIGPLKLVTLPPIFWPEI